RAASGEPADPADERPDPAGEPVPAGAARVLLGGLVVAVGGQELEVATGAVGGEARPELPVLLLHPGRLHGAARDLPVQSVDAGANDVPLVLPGEAAVEPTHRDVLAAEGFDLAGELLPEGVEARPGGLLYGRARIELVDAICRFPFSLRRPVLTHHRRAKPSRCRG